MKFDLLPTLSALGARTVSDLKTELQASGHSATGRTAEALGFEVSLSGNTYSLRIIGPDWWPYTDKGRGPGKRPPIEAIQEWINAKGLDISAWAVAGAIAKAGTNKPASNFTRRPLEKLREDLPGEIAKEAAGQARALLLTLKKH